MTPRTGQLEMVWGQEAAAERAAEWSKWARLFISEANIGVRFTADTMREIIGDPPGHGDAIGAAFGAASRAQLIRVVGYRTSTRPDAHGRLLREWERVVPLN